MMRRHRNAPLRRAAGGAAALLLVAGALPLRAQETAAPNERGVDGFRAKLEKWVETRQIVSEERSEWRAEEETLTATRDLLREQKEKLRSEIEELEASASRADEERRELLLQRGEFQRANRSLEERIRELEDAILALAPRLPEPLREEADPLLVQIPESDEKAAERQLGTRLVNVLGVLSQAEKWNGTASLVGETRAVGGGEEKLQVRTLYWGLSQAFYVAAQGRAAGVARPRPEGSEGWEFHDRPELADDAGLLLDIYEGNVDAIQFVTLPVEIQ